jgi:hypothetical protein
MRLLARAYPFSVHPEATTCFCIPSSLFWLLQVSAGFEPLLEELLQARGTDYRPLGHTQQQQGEAPSAAAVGATSSVSSDPHPAALGTGPKPLTADVEPSPGLVATAAGGVSLLELFGARGLPTLRELKTRLLRSREDEAAFRRRLQLLAAINVVRTRALLKTTGRFVPVLFYATRYLAGIDASAAAILRAFMLRDDPTWLVRLTAWASHVSAV